MKIRHSSRTGGMCFLTIYSRENIIIMWTSSVLSGWLEIQEHSLPTLGKNQTCKQTISSRTWAGRRSDSSAPFSVELNRQRQDEKWDMKLSPGFKSWNCLWDLTSNTALNKPTKVLSKKLEQLWEWEEKGKEEERWNKMVFKRTQRNKQSEVIKDEKTAGQKSSEWL